MTNSVKSIWKRVATGKPDECWPWMGYLSGGRGRIDIAGVEGVYVHRVAYLAANPGTIKLLDDGSREECVCHTCDNPLCCNPNHLFLGSHDDNMADKVAKGRSKIWKHSTKTPRAKLTSEDVFFMRMQKKYGATKNALAMLYEVSTATVSGALYGRHYRDVP